MGREEASVDGAAGQDRPRQPLSNSAFIQYFTTWIQSVSQSEYVDEANVNNNEQESRFQETLKNTEPWSKVRKVCRNYTTVCAATFPDEYLDFVYVDARHDRKGWFDDIASYWPKLRKGGIMAGHDYVRQTDLQVHQDWTVNQCSSDHIYYIELWSRGSSPSPPL